MPLIHLPVQSGSNKILRNMNRKHTVEYSKKHPRISLEPENSTQTSSFCGATKPLSTGKNQLALAYQQLAVLGKRSLEFFGYYEV